MVGELRMKLNKYDWMSIIFRSGVTSLPIIYIMVGVVNEYKFVVFLIQEPIMFFMFIMGWIFLVVNLFRLSDMMSNTY